MMVEMRPPTGRERPAMKNKATFSKKECSWISSCVVIALFLFLLALSSRVTSSRSLRRAIAGKLELREKNDIMFVSFYYPWYNNGDWTKHDTQGSHPMLGQYGSDDVSIAAKHIDWAVDKGGIDAWAVSWWNPQSPSAIKFSQGMLKAKNIDKIKFCMVYESLGALPVRDFANGTKAIDKFTADMEYFRDNYFSHSSYLYVNGRPVVYVYVARSWKNFTQDMLMHIKEKVGIDILFIADIPYFGLNGDPKTAISGMIDGKPIFEAYTAYNMYEARLVQEGESATEYMFRESLGIFERWSRDTVFFPHVLPKYHDFRDGHPQLVGDPPGLLTQLQTFACLRRPSWYKNEFPNLIFVTSFNEWWEGTSLEPDAEGKYGFSFLDTLRRFKYSELQCSNDEAAAVGVNVRQRVE
jgi:hypothetical protein